jgi:hypothetical protein
MKIKLLFMSLALVILSGCVVGNSPMERKHRQGMPSTPYHDEWRAP